MGWCVRSDVVDDDGNPETMFTLQNMLEKCRLATPLWSWHPTLETSSAYGTAGTR